jgi:DNA polymerase III delta prime subunit
MTASTRRANYTVIPVDAAVIPKKAGSPKRNVKKYVGGGVGVVATTPATTTPTTVITAAVPEVREWADLVGNVAVIKRVCDNIVILQQSESQERGRRAKQAAEFAILAEKVERATHATDVARTAASRRASANAILHAFPDDGDDEEDSSNPPQTQSRARTISNERDVHQRRHSKSKDKYPSQHSHGGPKSRNSKGNSNVFNRKGATEARGKEKAGGNDKKKKGGVSANANEKERKTVDRDEEEEEKEAEKEDVALMQLSETSNRLERQQTRLLNEEREYRTMQQAHLKKIMLLHGPPGVGKSSCTRLIARHLGRRAVILNMSLLRNREQVSELVRTLVFRKTSVPPLPALFTPLSSSSSSSSSSSTLSLHHTNSASVARSSPPPSSSPTHKPPPPPSPRDLVAAASAGRVVDDMIRRVDSTTVTNEKFATTGKNIYVTGKNIYVTGKPIYVTAKDEEARKRKAVEEARVKVAAAEAFREMVDPVLVVLEEMDGMSPQGMAALAALFKEISESPREFQPLLCVCNDTTKLKKYKIMSYMHGHLFESLTQPALSTIAERNGFMTWNTPRLAALVTEARGDARHLLHSLALDNHRRPPPPLSIPPSLSIPPPLSIPIPLASSSNITRHVTTPPTTSKGFSSLSLSLSVCVHIKRAFIP